MAQRLVSVDETYVFPDPLEERLEWKMSRTTAEASPVHTQGLLAGGTQIVSDTHEQRATLPALTNDITSLEDLVNRTGDGAKYFTMLRVGHRPGVWLDEYYGYVSGHDSLRLWLVTAPTPFGPWTWQDPIIGVEGVTANITTNLFQAHVASPDAMWVGDQIYLYFHGHKKNEPGATVQQPTGLAVSSDGRNFVEQGYVFETTRGVNDGNPYSTSRSYARVVKDVSLYHAVWQSQTATNNQQAGIWITTVGHAVSHDGINWRDLPPLLTNEPGDQGPFSPSIVKIPSGWLLATTYRQNVAGAQVDKVRMYFSKTLESGRFRLLGDITLPAREGREQTAIQSPFFYVHDRSIYMYYGAPVVPGSVSSINVAEIRWEN